MRAVLDTGVVVAGIFWRRESHLCLVAFGWRQFAVFNLQFSISNSAS